MASDRILGLVLMALALAYIASAFQIRTSFLIDPVGPKTVPIIIGALMALCGAIIFARPDPDPQWPGVGTFLRLGFAAAVLVGYAFALKPLGFLLPTTLAAGVLSYQIKPRLLAAVLVGLGLGIGLFVLFRYVLKLGITALPPGMLG